MEIRKAAALSRFSDLVAEIEDPYRGCLAIIDHLHRNLDYQRRAVVMTRADDAGLAVCAHCHGGRIRAQQRAEIARVNAVLGGLTAGALVSGTRGRSWPRSRFMSFRKSICVLRTGDDPA